MLELPPRPASKASLNGHPFPREGGREDGSRLAGKAGAGKLQVAIVGAGPVGLAFALLLKHAGIGCEVLDARPAGALRNDRRLLALSHGSRQILERLGAWTAIGATSIARVHISQQGRLGRTLIRAEDAGVPALGYAAEADRVGAALAQACAAAGVAVRHGTKATGAEAGPDRALLHCIADERAADLEAQLIVWAEGAINDADGSVRRDYRQQAIVATVLTRTPPDGTAYERFTAAGAVALLPLEKRYGLIWTARDCDAALLALDDRVFLSRLHDMFSGRLDFTTTSARTAFRLGLRYRATPVAERTVWLGNAAQTLHPVAGQGFNLALRDAVELARLLPEHPSDCGDAALLARHAAARRMDRRGAIGFTDGLIRLFGAPGALAGHTRGAGLLALDLLPAGRRFLARRMIFGARAW